MFVYVLYGFGQKLLGHHCFFVTIGQAVEVVSRIVYEPWMSAKSLKIQALFLEN